MSSRDPLPGLLALAQAGHDRAQHRIRALLAEEQRLRATLERLREMAQAPLTPAQRSVGADLLWRGWISQQRAAANTRLARVLAQKEIQLTELRQTFGKVAVLRDLIRQDRKRAQKQAADRKLERMIALQMLETAADLQ